MSDQLYVGRKEICRVLGVSWRTVRRWIKERNLPVLQERGFLPSLHSEELREWHWERREIRSRRS